MKKAIVIFFLSCFVLSQTGHFVIYQIQKWHIKNIAREAVLAGVPDSHLEIIEYTNAVKWEEEGKEFRIKDEFYDVICIKKQNGKIFLYCLNDKNEEDLVRNFDKTIKSAADNEKGKNDKHSFKFPLPDQLIIYFVSSGPLGNTVLHHYFNYTTTLVSNCREIIIPPPRGLA